MRIKDLVAIGQLFERCPLCQKKAVIKQAPENQNMLIITCEDEQECGFKVKVIL